MKPSIKDLDERRAVGRVVSIGKSLYVTLPPSVLQKAGIKPGELMAWNVHHGVLCGEIIPFDRLAKLPKLYRRIVPRKSARAARLANKEAGAA